MTFQYWRGRLLLRLAKMLDRWATAVTQKARRDLGASAMPDDDLFTHNRNDWGGR